MFSYESIYLLLLFCWDQVVKNSWLEGPRTRPLMGRGLGALGILELGREERDQAIASAGWEWERLGCTTRGLGIHR